MGVLSGYEGISSLNILDGLRHLSHVLKVGPTESMSLGQLCMTTSSDSRNFSVDPAILGYSFCLFCGSSTLSKNCCVYVKSVQTNQIEAICHFPSSFFYNSV